MWDEIKKYAYWLPFLLMFILVLGWFLLRDNGGGTDNLRDQLNQAGTNQHYITTQLDETGQAAGELRKEIGTARNQVDNINRDQQTAGELIAECQQILKGVRARGEAQSKNN